MKWPASCQARTVSTAPGYGSEARICGSEWVSFTAAESCSGLRRSISHTTCSVYGIATPKRRWATSSSRSQ